MKKTILKSDFVMKLVVLLLGILLLGGCSDDNTPEELTRALMQEATEYSFYEIKRHKYKMDISPPKSKVSAEERSARYAPGFNKGTLNRHGYIIWLHLGDHYKDNYEDFTFDIGEAKTDGTRSVVSAYVGPNECQFSYSLIDDKWRLAKLECSEYQY